jgi:hypothetical protein
MKAIWGVLALFAVVLSGCASTATPSTLATPTTPSEEQSAVATADPGPSVANAPVASLTDYFEAANSVASGGALREFRALFAETCASCMSAYQDFESAQAQGLRADGERYLDWEIFVEEQTAESALLRSTVDFAPVNLVDGSGQVAASIDAWADVQFVWTLQRQEDGAWLIIQGQQL